MTALVDMNLSITLTLSHDNMLRYISCLQTHFTLQRAQVNYQQLNTTYRRHFPCFMIPSRGFAGPKRGVGSTTGSHFSQRSWWRPRTNPVLTRIINNLKSSASRPDSTFALLVSLLVQNGPLSGC